MPKWCGGMAVAAMGWLAMGCVAHRPPEVVVAPHYSYIRDGGRIAVAVDPSMPRDSVEELAAPFDLIEEAWLTPPLPRRELVRVSVPPATE